MMTKRLELMDAITSEFRLSMKTGAGLRMMSVDSLAALQVDLRAHRDRVWEEASRAALPSEVSCGDCGERFSAAEIDHVTRCPACKAPRRVGA